MSAPAVLSRTHLATSEIKPLADDATFVEVLHSVCIRLEGAAPVTGAEAREAAALAIFAEVARFVLRWQEGPAR